MERAPQAQRPPSPLVERADSAAIRAGLSPDVRFTAAALGASADLEQLAALKLAGAPAAEREAPRRRLMDALARGSLDVASTVALLDCEAERASTTATALRTANQEQSDIITVVALVTGGLSAALAGVLGFTTSDPLPSAIVGVAGGSAEVALSVAALTPDAHADFKQPLNPVAQLWSGEAHPSFPESVWAFFTTPEDTDEGPRTARDWLRQAWRTTGRLGVDPAADALLLGETGEHTAKLLTERAVMLTEIRSVAALFHQDLRQLAAVVDSLAEDQATSTGKER